jgi:hypothetical protein
MTPETVTIESVLKALGMLVFVVIASWALTKPWSRKE